eukprot:3994072-Amphidinium_carterae.1
MPCGCTGPTSGQKWAEGRNMINGSAIDCNVVKCRSRHSKPPESFQLHEQHKYTSAMIVIWQLNRRQLRPPAWNQHRSQVSRRP